MTLTTSDRPRRTPQEIKKHQENIMNRIKNIMVFSLLYSIIESSRGTKNKQTKKKEVKKMTETKKALYIMFVDYVKDTEGKVLYGDWLQACKDANIDPEEIREMWEDKAIEESCGLAVDYYKI
jgi:hypothetical protein